MFYAYIVRFNVTENFLKNSSLGLSPAPRSTRWLVFRISFRLDTLPKEQMQQQVQEH